MHYFTGHYDGYNQTDNNAADKDGKNLVILIHMVEFIKWCSLALKLQFGSFCKEA